MTKRLGGARSRIISSKHQRKFRIWKKNLFRQSLYCWWKLIIKDFAANFLAEIIILMIWQNKPMERSLKLLFRSMENWWRLIICFNGNLIPLITVRSWIIWQMKIIPIDKNYTKSFYWQSPEMIYLSVSSPRDELSTVQKLFWVYKLTSNRNNGHHNYCTTYWANWPAK